LTGNTSRVLEIRQGNVDSTLPIVETDLQDFLAAIRHPYSDDKSLGSQGTKDQTVHVIAYLESTVFLLHGPANNR